LGKQRDRQATAILLAQRGAKLVLGARNSARLEALTERITDAGGHYGRTDVTRRGDLTELVAVAQQQYGKLDALINNAGVMPISLTNYAWMTGKQ
jgi:NADP-dependent 3-hydroxy acid dehydrogenase YdfG